MMWLAIVVFVVSCAWDWLEFRYLWVYNFYQVWKFDSYFSKYIFYSSPRSCGNSITTTLGGLKLPFLFFDCVLYWIVSITVFSNSLIFPFTVSNVLLISWRDVVFICRS